MEKGNKAVVTTQIRLGEDIYAYAKSEANRLAVSLNSALNNILDDGRRWREAKVIIRTDALIE